MSLLPRSNKSQYLLKRSIRFLWLNQCLNCCCTKKKQFQYFKPLTFLNALHFNRNFPNPKANKGLIIWTTIKPLSQWESKHDRTGCVFIILLIIMVWFKAKRYGLLSKSCEHFQGFLLGTIYTCTEAESSGHGCPSANPPPPPGASYQFILQMQGLHEFYDIIVFHLP